MRPANDQPMPSITALDAEGGSVTVPEAVAGRWAAVLIYRGHW
jgi:hypothetical protein